MDKSDQALIMAVKAKREAAGLSLRALSNEVGVSFSTLARIERGDGSPDNNSKIRLIEWLGPDAEAAGLALEHVALVHFRAMKNVQSGTVQALLRAAICLRREHSSNDDGDPTPLRVASPTQTRTPRHRRISLRTSLSASARTSG